MPSMPDEIGDAQAEQAAELLEPAAVSTLFSAAAAGPPYSFCEFSPQTISGTLNCTAARTGMVKMPTCSGQEMSPTSRQADAVELRAHDGLGEIST